MIQTDSLYVLCLSLINTGPAIDYHKAFKAKKKDYSPVVVTFEHGLEETC